MSDITPEDREALVGQAAYHLRKREEAEEQLAISQKYRSEAERQSTAWARDLEEWKQSFQRVLGERDAERVAHEATKEDWKRRHSEWLEQQQNEIAARQAAEARVAELETMRDVHAEARTGYAKRVVDAEAAIDQARELLERAPVDPTQRQSTGWCRLRDEWLRAHPATVTPAATGAEPECGKCRMLGALGPCDGCHYGTATDDRQLLEELAGELDSEDYARHCDALRRLLTRAEAAEARVSELETCLAVTTNSRNSNHAKRLEAETALDQARKTLAELYKATPLIPSANWGERYQSWLRANAPAATTAATGAKPKVQLSTYPGCRSGRDGECFWEECPQLRDGEPARSGRHCPRDLRHDDE